MYAMLMWICLHRLWAGTVLAEKGLGEMGLVAGAGGEFAA